MIALLQKYRGIAFQALLVSLLLVALLGLQLVFTAPKVLAKRLPQSTVEMETMSLIAPEKVRSIVDKAAASWVDGDANAFASLFTPDGEFIVPGQRWVGSTAIEHVAAEFARSHAQVSIKIQRLIVAGQQAVVEWHWEDVESSTGKRTRADDAIVVDFEHDKVKRWREYIDSTSPHEMG